MNIAIRVDASTPMGLGHLTRCRTLAKGFQERGAFVHFVCRAHPGHQIQMLEAEGYLVSSLPKAPEQNATDGGYAAWLGVSQDQDADETLAALNKLTKNRKEAKWDWLIVDHYGLDKAWEQRLLSVAKQILVIDDLANREHDCDVLLDQNFSRQPDKRYAKLLPKHTQVLLGPDFALLHPQYAMTRQTLERCYADIGCVNPVRRVLVFFGGTDPENLTGRCLEALRDPALSEIVVDIVVGANNPHKEALRRQAAARGATHLHEPRLHLVDLMAEADLAIGAGGTTTWERCCLGLPSLVISIAENQQPACNALAVANIIDYLGHYKDVKAADITRGISRLVNDPVRRQKLTNSGSTLVDGLGVQRVVDAILQEHRKVSNGQTMPLVPLTADHLELILPWRNAPTVRRAMYNQHEISLEEHLAWFEQLKGDNTKQWYVYQDEAGEPQGVVYFTDINREPQTAFWGFYARPDAASGTGLDILMEALDFAFESMGLHKVNAEVLIDNPRSAYLHNKVGFIEEGRFREQHLVGNERIDIVRLGLLSSEWFAYREKLARRVSQLLEIKDKSTPPPPQKMRNSDAV